jgi:hypothetical protein
VRRVGCHTWAGPELADLQQAAATRPDAPEVWCASEHPHLRDIAALWPNATLRTVGSKPPTVRRAFAVHEDGDPARLEHRTLDRPKHTVVCPWSPPARPSASARRPAAQG